MSSFESLGLIKQLVKAVEDKGYQKPTPIQAKAIPAVLSGRDVIGGAQTGTGKTAAFALPILQDQFQNRTKDRSPRALIITPTRELAVQVEKFVHDYSKGLGVYSCALYGGVKMDPQIRLLRRGVGIVVATPGRLLDHAERGTIKLSKIKTFVLDEADRMLDMGFLPDIKKIISLIPSKSQSLLFSATYSDEIRELSKSFLNNPEKVEVARRNTTAELVRQIVHPVEKSKKRELLVHMINDGEWDQVLVFARTRHGAEKLSKQLTKDGIQSVAIHGDKTQGHRTRSLERFKKGTVRVLVATDVASRGLDIKQLPRVVNYELPDVAEDYVHRIGRTGRAKEKGDAHSFVSKSESKKLSAVEELLGNKINRAEIEGFEGELIEYRAEKKKVRSRKNPRRSRSGERQDSKFNKKSSFRKDRPSRFRKSDEESGDENYKPQKRNFKRGKKVPSRDSKDKYLQTGKRPRLKEEEPKKKRRGPKSEKDFENKDFKRPKKARPDETKEERRKRKPKWSSAKKKAAKIKRAKEAKENRPKRTKRGK
ncbi:MAG: DEAD/DEAH box helicase [Verrucomicrobiota bacterium]|nr:DEAD/DEAH box helicase [Verrucomicrobiota bacterium]